MNDPHSPWGRDWGPEAPWMQDDPHCDECGGALEEIDGEMMCLECEAE